MQSFSVKLECSSGSKVNLSFNSQPIASLLNTVCSVEGNLLAIYYPYQGIIYSECFKH